MNNTPPQLREELSNDPFYEKCCLAFLGGCFGKIEWHHALKYASSQVQKKFAILPVCCAHHKKARQPEINQRMGWVVWSRASEEEIQRYSKASDYYFERNRLIKKYGIYNSTR